MEIAETGRFPVVEEIVNDETRVRLFGDTAVITGRSKYLGERTAVVRHTMIWVKEDGRWQMVGWQGTALPGEAAYGPDRGAKNQHEKPGHTSFDAYMSLNSCLAGKALNTGKCNDLAQW